MSNTITIQLPEEVILDALRQLPAQRRQQLLQQLAEDQKVTVVSFPATELNPMIGVISVGGDALEESERLYDDE